MFKKKDLTVEELKEQAERLGYRITKKDTYVKFKPCICGNNKRTYTTRHLVTDSEDRNEKEIIYTCTKCGISAGGKTDKQARINWNEKITRMIEEDPQLLNK